ncbi:MAG: hypothetical protein R3B51_12900 [Thermodesulfobacteriota bacterium]
MSFIFIMPLTFARARSSRRTACRLPSKIFAENQPFTVVIQAMRAWLVGTPIGNDGWLSVVWCIGITAVCMPIAAWLFRRQARFPLFNLLLPNSCRLVPRQGGLRINIF